ncbi:MAG: hypothetical protein GY854_26585 [Deltaproteobacteria bacterium]|nr:hypothetical protein [Deltaproteobacteria bacterium]
MMIRYLLLFLVSGLVLWACGGSSGSKKTNATTEVQVELTPMQELQALFANLQTGLDEIMQPINDIELAIDDMTTAPERLNMNAAAFMEMAKSTMNSGQISISAGSEISAEAMVELKATLFRLKRIVAGLKATPEKIVQLTAQASSAVAQVPFAATKVTSVAQAAIANPMASAEAKTQAQADIDAVASIEADVSAQIGEIQQKFSGIPAMATEALAKLTATLSGGI